MEQLKLPNLQYTPTLLQLANRFVIKPDVVVEDVSTSLDSWEYPVDFMILNPKNNLGGHPLILGRPCLATTNAFISCRFGDMYISDGSSTNKFTLYPPAKTITKVESEIWIDDDNEDFNELQLVYTLSQLDEEYQLINLTNNNDSSS